MFETSVVNAQTKAAPRRIGLFTVSLIAHTAVILGVAAVSVASVNFPTEAPDEVANAPIFQTLTIPPPLGNPNGGAPPRPAATPVPKRETPPPPDQVTAPPVIPDDVPVADAATTPGDANTDASGPATGPGTEPGPFGDPNGDPNSILVVDPPQIVPVTPKVEDKVYQPGGEVKPPVAIYKTQPPYPSSMVRNRIPATVAIRCIIDKNGNVRDPQIIKGAMPPFNDAVIKTVLQWRFQPGSYRGQAVETYLDLSVTFQVQ